MGYLKNELTGFVPVEQATEIIKMVTRGSSVLRMVKELRQAVLLGFTLKSRRRS